jgi:hypothetical protein
MGARGDFEVLTFKEHLGDNEGNINTDFPFMGQLSSEQIFEINQQLFQRSGFVQYQVSHVDELSHEILVNGDPLPNIDVFRTGQGKHTGLQTHTDTIPFSFFKQGQNTIRFKRIGGDNFLIHHVIVHWRELDPA